MVAIQEGACGRLGWLATGDDKNRKKVANLGGIEAILKAMNEHAAHAKVQETACEALDNLSFNDDNAVKIRNLGGIEALLKAMKDHPAEANVQEKACEALKSLIILNDDNKVTIANLGGVQALLKAMKDHPSKANVQEKACMALTSLAYDDDIKARIKREGGEEQARRVKAAAKTYDTRKAGQELLDTLADKDDSD